MKRIMLKAFLRQIWAGRAVSGRFFSSKTSCLLSLGLLTALFLLSGRVSAEENPVVQAADTVAKEVSKAAETTGTTIEKGVNTAVEATGSAAQEAGTAIQQKAEDVQKEAAAAVSGTPATTGTAATSGTAAAKKAQATAPSWVLLKTDAKGNLQISGDAALADKKVIPASTFKVLIAWAALEEGDATPQTTYLVHDKHIPGAPCEIDMHMALYYSSNDYFNWLGGLLGPEKLSKYVALSGYGGGQVPQNWMKTESKISISAGAGVRVTPRENHEFMRKVAEGKLASSKQIQEDLLQVMRWPCDDASREIYGKTGTYPNLLWFNGFCKMGKDIAVVTVLDRADYDERPKVNARFYKACGAKYNPDWAKQYPGP